ncbi:MAG: hypothetical protein WC556_11055 [Candidatus Methanoperedens sp.]
MKRNFKGISGEETLQAGFEATELALSMLRASIENANPGFGDKEIEAEMTRIIQMQRKEKDEFARKFYAGRT